jgi:hypothetical protein
VVNALPPLFGPAVLPGPFDYAAIATGDAVAEQVAAEHDLTPDALRPRLSANVRANTTEIDFIVTGDDALSIARTWNRVFGEEAANRTGALQTELTQPYADQRDQAAVRLEEAYALAAANPQDALAQAGLAAAQDNYETAARLMDSYDIVRQTMTAQAFTLKTPHEYGDVAGPLPARLAAGALAGFVVGVLLIAMLDVLDRRRARDAALDETPSALRRVEERTGSSR